jgi:transposase-like protein
MDRRRRFTEEFRIEAVKQITERGFAVNDVTQRLGIRLISSAALRSSTISPIATPIRHGAVEFLRNRPNGRF